MEEKLKRERDGGGFWSNVSNGIMDSFGDSGRNVDDSSRELSSVHKEVSDRQKKDEKIDSDLVKKLVKSENGVNGSIKDYQESKDKVANGLTTGVAVGIALGVSIATAGAGAAVSVPWLIGSSLGIATAKVAVNKAREMARAVTDSLGGRGLFG